MARIFAVGDVHGCLDKLEKLFSKIDVAREDTVIFLGDYIDRGPEPRGVVDYLLDIAGRGWKTLFLMGNHEDLFFDYLKGGTNRDLFLINGGWSTLISYGYPEKFTDLPESHQLFYEQLLSFYETEDYFFVHAGFAPEKSLKNQTKEDLLWIREEFYLSSFDFGKTVVFGHTPFNRVFYGRKKIGIDTGAVYGGFLTCLELPRGYIYQT